MSDFEPKIDFEIYPGTVYTPERQRQVTDCRKRANDEFIAYAIGKLQRDGTVERDWPVHIRITVRSDAVSWALVSKSGHRFSASSPEHRVGCA